MTTHTTSQGERVKLIRAIPGDEVNYATVAIVRYVQLNGKLTKFARPVELSTLTPIVR
jgi:hypothetical protein